MRWQEGGRRGEEKEEEEERKEGHCKLCPTTLLYCACSRNAKSQKRHPICKKKSKSTNKKWKNTTRHNHPPGCHTDQLLPVSMHVKNVNKIWKNEDLRDTE